MTLLGGYGGVAGDEFSEHATESLDTERQRRDVEQQDVGHVTGQHSALHGSSYCHRLVRVHSPRWSATEDLLNRLLNLYKNTRGLAYILPQESKHLQAQFHCNWRGV